MLPHLRQLQSVTEGLAQLQQPDEATTLARAIWRSLQLLPALQTSWSSGSFYSLMFHQVGMLCSACCSVTPFHAAALQLFDRRLGIQCIASDLACKGGYSHATQGLMSRRC